MSMDSVEICAGRKRKTPVEAFVGGAAVAGGIANGEGKVMGVTHCS